MRYLRPAVVLLAGLAMVLTAAAPAGALTKGQLKAKALAITDMPAGWSVDPAASQGGAAVCVASIKKVPAHEQKVVVGYDHDSFPDVEEVLTTGSGSLPAYNRLVKILNSCKSYAVTHDGKTETILVGVLSYPKVGTASSAYSLKLSAGGVNAGGYVVLFRTGQINGAVLYIDIGSPAISAVEKYVDKAVTKASS
jgi:hypothetical protein